MDRAVLMIVITDRSRGGEFASWFQTQGATLVLSALGQGTAATEVLDYLGLEATERLCCSWRPPGPPGWCGRRPGSCGWTCRGGGF